MVDNMGKKTWKDLSFFQKLVLVPFVAGSMLRRAFLPTDAEIKEEKKRRAEGTWGMSDSAREKYLKDKRERDLKAKRKAEAEKKARIKKLKENPTEILDERLTNLEDNISKVSSKLKDIEDNVSKLPSSSSIDELKDDIKKFASRF